jgi:hypothetical protein
VLSLGRCRCEPEEPCFHQAWRCQVWASNHRHRIHRPLVHRHLGQQLSGVGKFLCARGPKLDLRAFLVWRRHPSVRLSAEGTTSSVLLNCAAFRRQLVANRRRCVPVSLNNEKNCEDKNLNQKFPHKFNLTHLSAAATFFAFGFEEDTDETPAFSDWGPTSFSTS